MKNLFKKAALAAVIAFSFIATTNAQVGGNSYGAGDNNLGDLDQLGQSITVSINLETILQLHAPSDPAVAFVFDEMGEFKNGIKAEDPTNGGQYLSPGVTNGKQEFAVDATVNWKLDWRADVNADYVEGINTSGNRAQTLMLNNVGAKFNTENASTEIEPTDEGAIALTKDDFTVIKRESGASNIGDADANKFTVLWRVGTKETPEESTTPAMNQSSLLEQQIGSEAFKFDVLFTLSQDDPWIQ